MEEAQTRKPEKEEQVKVEEIPAENQKEVQGEPEKTVDFEQVISMLQDQGEKRNTDSESRFFKSADRSLSAWNGCRRK